MPILGADMEAGTLVAWRKQPGDRVRRGEVVAEVETEKGLIDVEIFVSGVIDRFLVQPGQKVPVGTVLAVIRDEGAPAEAPLPRPGCAHAGDGPAADLPARAGARGRARRRSHHAARHWPGRRDHARGRGTGGGRACVCCAAAGPGPRRPPGALRQTIGAAMARAKREIPHYYLSTTIDLGRATDWLTAENARRAVPDRLLLSVMLVKAAALALREVPELNARWADGRAHPSADIHVGVAISLRGGGLVAPALHGTDRRTLDELMAGLRDLVKRARAGTLRSSELSDPTITVTSLGEQGVESVFGIIYPPQVAILGFGRVMERPWVVEGQVVPRPLVTASLSADHRVTDGHRGGLFLTAIERLLQEPARL